MASLGGLRARLERLEAVLKPGQTVVMFRWGDHAAPVVAIETQGEFVSRLPNEAEEALLARALAPHSAFSWVVVCKHHQGSDFQRLRDPARWKLIEADESTNSLEHHRGVDDLLRDQPPRVREHIALVLEGVPPEQQREVYDRAISTVLTFASRGESEEPVRDLLERQAPDVSEAATGYGDNLDLEKEERENLEDALARVEEHNRRVRKRMRPD